MAKVVGTTKVPYTEATVMKWVATNCIINVVVLIEHCVHQTSSKVPLMYKMVSSATSQ